MPRERGEHGRPDRERHSSRNLIDALTPLRVRWRVIVPHDPRLNRTAIKPTRPHHGAKPLRIRENLSNSWLKMCFARVFHPPALIETPPQQSRGSAKEGSTVVSTVKDTGAATSSRVKPRHVPTLPGCP
jgi:hypothetical protein